MKRYQYYQPNDKDLRDKVGDCQIRALSKALDLSWTETFDLISPLCREYQTLGLFDLDLGRTKEVMSKLGFEYHGISNKKGSTRPTVFEFAKNNQQGTYIVVVAHHVVAVKDGMYFDTWDSGFKSLYGYYEHKE